MKKYQSVLKEAEKEYGIRWSEFDRNDRIIKKEKIFKSKEQLEKFISQLIDKDNFNSIEAWLNESTSIEDGIRNFWMNKIENKLLFIDEFNKKVATIRVNLQNIKDKSVLQNILKNCSYDVENAKYQAKSQKRPELLKTSDYLNKLAFVKAIKSII